MRQKTITTKTPYPHAGTPPSAAEYDLVAILRVRQHEELADLVTANLQRIPGILATNTLIAFRAYSAKDLAAMWEIGLEEA
jgi:DNA-binding Lrp family transcriptional regulator